MINNKLINDNITNCEKMFLDKSIRFRLEGQITVIKLFKNSESSLYSRKKNIILNSFTDS